MESLIASLFIVVGWTLLLTGCNTTGPKYETPSMPLPAKYRNSVSTTDTENRSAIVKGPWWTHYGSSELDELIGQGLANNSDLRIATLQIAQAKIRAAQTKAGNLPTLTAPISVAAQGSGGTVNTKQSTQVRLQATYHLDMWGEQRAMVESAEFQVSRAVYERENVQRNMIGSLVSAYIAYLMSCDSLNIASENESVSKDILVTVEKRFALGDATSNEIEQQRSALALQQATMASLEIQREDIKTTIARLVGALQADLNLSDMGLDSLVSPSIDVGVPSSLIFQRPDIRMIEAKMRAANANIDVARAKLLPPIDLAMQAGYSGVAISQLLQAQSLFWSSVASLAVTIFDGGRREGDKAFAQSYYEEMVETYRQTIFQAIREVESAVFNLKASGMRYDAQKRSARAALSMFKIASNSYTLGAIDLTTLLDARKNYQRSLDDSQRTKAELLKVYASLGQALAASDE